MFNSPQYAGPVPEEIWTVLKASLRKGVALQGDFARQHAKALALAASVGWVSIITPNKRQFEPRWRITLAGHTALNFKELFKTC